MKREEKAQVIERLAGKLREGSAILVDYQGMDVARTTDLRRRSRESDVEFVVAKNTLAKRAADQAGVEGLQEFLQGPTALAFSEDPVVSAKLMAEFADQVETFALKGGVLDGGVSSMKPTWWPSAGCRAGSSSSPRLSAASRRRSPAS